MGWESWNARETAWLRIERASARTIEEEIAARWWGKKRKDWAASCVWANILVRKLRRESSERVLTSGQDQSVCRVQYH
jgi:hypothetical protein